MVKSACPFHRRRRRCSGRSAKTPTVKFYGGLWSKPLSCCQWASGRWNVSKISSSPKSLSDDVLGGVHFWHCELLSKIHVSCLGRKEKIKTTFHDMGWKPVLSKIWGYKEKMNSGIKMSLWFYCYLLKINHKFCCCVLFMSEQTKPTAAVQKTPRQIRGKGILIIIIIIIV